jgi:3-oxoacyl-[acyl-carrier-protein] synthase-1
MKQVSIPSGASLTALYREWVGDYPKFFKMDTLSKLGFLLTEMLVHDEPDRFTFREDRAVLVFSREGCIANDRHYAESMQDFPSPALFVYTLPNIVSGEISIRNKWGGESSAFVLESYDEARIWALVRQAFQDKCTQSALVAWMDCKSDTEWVTNAWLVDETDML